MTRPPTSAAQARRKDKAIRLRRRHSRAMPRLRPARGRRRTRAGGGGGFLQNAASTAAGVAGGVVLGNMLGGLFGGHQGGGASSAGGLGGFGGAGVPGSETINNFYEMAPNGHDSAQFDPSAPDDAGYHRRFVVRRFYRAAVRLRLTPSSKTW